MPEIDFQLSGVIRSRSCSSWNRPAFVW